MDELATTTTSSLYEQDFYAWTQAQSELLRSGRLDEADIANILEEIETLGRQEVAELRSRLKVLALHLLKEMIQPEKASRSWTATIIAQRQDLTRHVRDDPSLKPRIPEIFAEAYADARVLASAETGLPLGRFPAELAFSYGQAMNGAFWPGRAPDDRG